MNRTLHDVVEPVLGSHALELEDISTAHAGSRTVVRITVDGDGPDGHGPTLDEVASASSAISVALDESNVMGEKAYVLEIGTRGVDAPLTKPAHWRRNIGRLVKVRVGDGEPALDRIVSADEEGAVLESLGRVLYTDVRKAVVQVEMRDAVAATDELDLEDADDESSADDLEGKD
jgi:ribosome maturation factor RimP